MTMSRTELSALHNLADKHGGHEVGWISIADARALTDQGLAKRTRSGWEITLKGLSLVAEAGPMVRSCAVQNLFTLSPMLVS